MYKEMASIISDYDFEKIELRLGEPNIFSALSIERKEIRHSNFIAYLLDPQKNHGLKDLLLRRFIRDVFLDSKVEERSIFDADIIDYRFVEVKREWRNIDIVLIFEKDVVVIENKVDAVDGVDQLRRYYDISEEAFPDKYKHYVYLTPYGVDPEDEKSRGIYINYSYLQLADTIESLLNLYGDNINRKIRHYLNDYVVIIKRELLMSDTLNELAVKVYNAHKEAFDFIFDNRPDPASELYPYFESKLQSAGFVIGSKNKGCIKFTTKELSASLPCTGRGWQNKEVFLFQIDYYWSDKYAVFDAVISPCDDEMRDKIHRAAKMSEHYKKPSGKKWLVIYKKKYPFIASEMINEDKSEIMERIDKIIKDIKPVVMGISETIANNIK